MVRFDFRKCRFPRGERSRRFVVRKVTAETITAMNRARSPVAISSARPWYFCMRPALPRSAFVVDWIGNKARNVERSHHRAASTCRSNGSAMSPGRMRATNPRGTKSGNCRVAVFAAVRIILRQIQKSAKLRRVANRVFHRLLPGGTYGGPNLGRTTRGDVDRMVISIL